MTMLKRILCLTLAALMLLSSAALAESELHGYTKDGGYVYVNLGQYPQTADGGVLPILWRVLTVDDEKAYLCSEYVLFAMPMHVNYTEYKTIGKDFGNTELCHYLNTTFSEDAFTEADLSLLMPFETYGKVFLLDSEDVKNKNIGMGTDNASGRWNGKNPGLRAWGTEYAIANGLYVFLQRWGAHSPYWVRNQATSDLRHARCTKDGGQLGHIVSDRENEGVRPAAYLDLSLATIASGTGTMDDPFVIVPKE